MLKTFRKKLGRPYNHTFFTPNMTRPKRINRGVARAKPSNQPELPMTGLQNELDLLKAGIKTQETDIKKHIQNYNSVVEKMAFIDEALRGQAAASEPAVWSRLVVNNEPIVRQTPR
jgi:hypothetical protein